SYMRHLTAIAAMACCAWLMVARNGLALSEEVGMLLDRPRNHPYLFFSAEEIPRLRERAQRPTWSDAAAMVVKTAEACLAAEIPPEPEAGPDKPYDEKGGYTTYYLKIHYDFYRAGQQINEIVPSLALAYLLTDDARYLNRAREWLAHFAGWRQWSVKSALADNQSAHSYMGLAIGYDWLWPHLTAAERTRILDGLRRLGETFQKHRGGLAQSALAGRRGGIANNHTWVSHSAPLLGALTQLYESPEAREWLDTEIVCWRDKILPASLGRDGEYVDGAGGWLDYCLQNAIPAFVALKRNGGPDLFRAPGTHLDRVAGFLMRANHWLADDARLPHYPLRYALLALASAYRDSAAQWCALANGLTVANAIKAPTYKGMERERSVPYEANRWTRVRMEWRVDTGRFKTSIDGEAVEDLPMLDRAFASVDRVTFAGHWKTQGDVEIRGIAVMDIGSGRNLDWPRLSALQVGPLQAAENLEVSTPDEAAAEISEDAGHRVLRLRDVSAKTYPTVGFRFTPLKHGAVEFELRKSDNDKSYAYARLWDGEKELRGVIFYTNGMILKHMPDYKNQDWPFGWRPEASHWFSAVWEFLFYDDSVPARRPERGVPSNVFRDLGWVTMRDTWDAQGMQVFFRSGPEMGKDHGDNNAFRLRAFGEDLLPELATPPSGEK
ncbi:MAG: DUF4962 domain-containing protein, partial [Planctomycetes bacterium]|nr:DUF4962 domain-containing protein [Planctomycetota bacterium]